MQEGVGLYQITGLLSLEAQIKSIMIIYDMQCESEQACDFSVHLHKYYTELETF